ncbi:hypothetical protein J3A83DRAFT_4093732, partial [Scleroderma citrinum]
PLDLMVIPGITMQGTSPMFYKIQVMRELVSLIASETYPDIPKVVYAHTPAFSRPDDHVQEGTYGISGQ